jgi:hypothetical protein
MVTSVCDQIETPVGKPVVDSSTKPLAMRLAGGNW